MANRGYCSMLPIEKNGTRTTLTDRYQGKRYIAPNDLVVRFDGSICFRPHSPSMRTLRQASTAGAPTRCLTGDRRRSCRRHEGRSPGQHVLHCAGGSRKLIYTRGSTLTVAL